MALEWTFNVDDCSTFDSRINELRNELRDPDREAPLYDGLYMLRPYTAVPERWLHLRLVSGDSQIVLWVRMDNLFLIGFVQEGGRTWEFNPNSGNTLIAGSEPLGFEGGYTNSNLGELLPDGDDNELGHVLLMNAVSNLALYQGGGRRGVRNWLRRIIVTIIEPIRSQEVCTHIDTILRGSGGWLTSRMICIIKNWEKVSICLIQSANNPDIPELYDHLILVKGVRLCGNTYEARQVVAIVYHGPAAANNNDNSRRPKRLTAAVGDVPTGLTFVEVFKVVIVNIDGENPGDLYGTVTVDDGLNPEVLFSRERSETQSVGPGGLAELTGPKRAIWGYDEVVLDFDLKDRDSFPDPSPDDEISKGQMVWNAHQRPETEYDRVNEYEVMGKNGSVNICYAVITNAVVATVVVYLTDGDGESYPDLYGTMTAATSAFPSHEVTLFDTKQDDFITMPAGDSIPLLRNVVVVPLGSSLEIKADLWDRDRLPDPSPDDHIADGEAVFGASLAGTPNKVITGPCGRVTVHVTWSRT